MEGITASIKTPAHRQADPICRSFPQGGRGRQHLLLTLAVCAVSPVTWSTNTLVAPERVLTLAPTVTHRRALRTFIHIWNRDEGGQEKRILHEAHDFCIHFSFTLFIQNVVSATPFAEKKIFSLQTFDLIVTRTIDPP